MMKGRGGRTTCKRSMRGWKRLGREKRKPWKNKSRCGRARLRGKLKRRKRRLTISMMNLLEGRIWN
jgi:hypothetical protein